MPRCVKNQQPFRSMPAKLRNCFWRLVAVICGMVDSGIRFWRFYYSAIVSDILANYCTSRVYTKHIFSLQLVLPVVSFWSTCSKYFYRLISFTSRRLMLLYFFVLWQVLLLQVYKAVRFVDDIKLSTWANSTLQRLDRFAQ